jgi:acetate kinase
MADERFILTVNAGSSSLKFAVFDLAGADLERRWSGALTRIALERGRFEVKDRAGETIVDETLQLANHLAAFDRLWRWLDTALEGGDIAAVGHRVVHGGEDCDCPLPVTPALEARLNRLTPLAPLHLPHNLAGIVAVRLRRPDMLQVACFDTAFHHSLPRIARMTGLPRRFETQGVRRYGYHGLSYEYVIDEIRARAGDKAAKARIIVAHLGNGASMAAIAGGRSVETTMGFSTLAGLPMGTRSGDIDPGAVLHLMLGDDMSAKAVQDLLYNGSGLLGLSGVSRNMEELLARPHDPAAADAVDYFCHHARRHLAGLTAALGGLDRLVFTGGIGANAAEIRARICEPLGYLGIALDAARNASPAPTISGDGAPVLAEAFATDEELVIARHTHHLLAERQAPQEVRAHG